MRPTKFGISAAAALAAAAAALPLFAQPALADYAPSSSDVVGVGSDTVQYAGDFLADGDFLGDAGQNSGGNLNKLISFDATPDANARLGYGAPGVGTGACPAGLGGTAGTGKQTTTHTDKPCTLNPTIVLRAGAQPVQRPNGSGAAANAGVADATLHNIDFLRTSAAKGSVLNAAGTTVQWDSVGIGTDLLGTLATTTTHAVPLSKAQLAGIYQCTTGYTTWSSVGGTSPNTIIPVIPQVGSGTRSSWLSFIGITDAQLGSCVITGEENDPFALAATASPDDAIEPMSGGRLNLFQGKNGAGANNGGTAGAFPYFVDPSCPVESTLTACNTGTATAPKAPSLVPAVQFLANSGTSTGTGGGAVATATTRTLYIYFRDADLNSTKNYQPGVNQNFVRALFYNPGTAAGTFGAGGAPYVATAAGQALISAAGINPVYTTQVPGA